MFLRDGIDKIMLTVRPKDLSISYSYPKLCADRYKANGNLTALKFSDRFSSTITIIKHLWEDKPAIRYEQRLDGFRQCRVYVNLMRYYNIVNGLPFYTHALFDNNVVIPSRMFDTTEFVQLMLEDIIPQIIDDYILFRDFIFDDHISRNEIEIDTHQLEFVNEAIGVHVNDIAETFIKYSKVESMIRYFSQTQTIYFNDQRKQQLKVYQKGAGIMRLEMTFNDRINDTLCEWKAPAQMIRDRLQERFDKQLIQMGIPAVWWELREMSLSSFIETVAELTGLYYIDDVTKDGVELMRVLLTSTCFKYSEMNKNLVQKLVRKKLIQRQSYGVYEPTARLKELQLLYERLKRVEELEQ